MEGKKEEKQIANASWQNSFSFQAQRRFCCLLVFARDSCVCAGRAVNWRHVGSRTESDIGEKDWGRCTAERAGRRGRERTKQSREKCCRWRMSFLGFFYNILRVVTVVSMKTVITLCIWAMSQSVFLRQEYLFRDFWWTIYWFMLNVNTSERWWWWLCELKMQSEIIQAHRLLR